MSQNHLHENKFEVK